MNKEKKIEIRKKINYGLLILCAAFVAVQFVTNFKWTNKAGETTQYSLINMLWLRTKNILPNLLKNSYGSKYDLNAIVNPLVLPMFLIVLELCFTIFSPKNIVIQCFAVAWGLIGSIMMIGNDLLAIGFNPWLEIVLIIISALAAVVGILEFIFFTNYKRD